jgi:NAD(P)-dependent dehydrogenase (short-subunit alcohol dehydrogenase family)
MLLSMDNAGSAPAAIVTAGAGPGIGHGLTEMLCEAGWSVLVTDRNEERADALAERLRRKGGVIETIVLDVTEPEAAERSVEAALGHFGRLDGLVNNVGVGLTKPVDEVSDDEFFKLFNVDFMATFRFTRAALPALRESGGAIVNIGSVHARLNAPKYALYAATKAALEAFTRGLSVDYGPDGVRANIVHPGLVESPQNEALLANLVANPRVWMDEFAQKRQCLPRLATPREVGALVAFLLGEQSRLITGQAICIDGGTTTLLWNNE